MSRMKKVLLVVAISMLCSMCVVMNAQSQTREVRSFDMEYYEELKGMYLERVRDVMESHYCMDSGVTFDYKNGEDGNMHYRLKVHHRRFEKMSSDELEQLYHELSAIAFMDGQPMPVVEFV